MGRLTAALAGVCAGATVLAVPLSPGAAERAASAFADLKTLCIDHRGSPDDSLKAAQGAGWMPAPRRAFDDLYSGLPIEGGVRMRSTLQNLEFLVAGHSKIAVDGGKRMAVTFCGLAESPHDQLLVKAVEDWAAVKPMGAAEDGSRIFVFTEEGGRHVPIVATVDTELPAKLGVGAVSVVTIDALGGSNGATFVTYGVLTLVEVARNETDAAKRNG